MLAGTVDAMSRGKFRQIVPQSSGPGRYYSTPDEAAIARFSAKNLSLVRGNELDLIP